MLYYPIPLNKQPAFDAYQCDLPIGDVIADKVISLPFHPYMDEESIDQVVDKLSQALRAS